MNGPLLFIALLKLSILPLHLHVPDSMQISPAIRSAGDTTHAHDLHLRNANFLLFSFASVLVSVTSVCQSPTQMQIMLSAYCRLAEMRFHTIPLSSILPTSLWPLSFSPLHSILSSATEFPRDRLLPDLTNKMANVSSSVPHAQLNLSFFLAPWDSAPYRVYPMQDTAEHVSLCACLN